MEKRFVVIDIGSNSIRCLRQGDEKKHSVTTRLGAGLAQSGRLAISSALSSTAVIADYVKTALSNGFTPVAYATSAVRDASNRDEFLKLVKQSCGINVDVLSGEREAYYAYRGAVGSRGGGLIDIGGASMQLVSERFQKSFPIGCVRGRDIALKATGCTDCDDDFPRQRETISEYVNSLVLPHIDAIRKECFEPCVGVGGTITTLGAFYKDPHSTEKLLSCGTVLTKTALEELIDKLASLKKERCSFPLLMRRHDVILYGASILSAAMDILNITSLTTSLRDGLDGYLEAILRGEIEPL